MRVRRTVQRHVLLVVIGLGGVVGAACGSSDERASGGGLDAGASDADAAHAPDAPADSELDAADVGADAPADVPAPPCPPEMAPVGGTCIDRFEAPGVEGGLPLVMYTFDESEAWCQQRGKRLCFDDEWTMACAGDSMTAYPYGVTHQPGVCNDDEQWRLYNQSLLSGWPAKASSPAIESLEELLAVASSVSASTKQSADHVEWLYQAEPSGHNAGCTAGNGVFDLTGNVEEWTRRRDGGEPSFHGSLKGRYWAETRTCQNGIKTHGDGFRFYEIGFRCCREVSE
ncbi:MAG: SUMF1/EgtB/PvdO family nonheme iron enzyme [Polyangiaceae bacterium]|nr:SUMF1/EgtB/PvdO family nonheme iron enzyme [Polyangiaceae bacterium]